MTTIDYDTFSTPVTMLLLDIISALTVMLVSVY